MNTLLFNSYKVLFSSSKGDRIIVVVAPSIHQACRVATSVYSRWEDKQAYEISSVSLVEPVFVSEYRREIFKTEFSYEK